MARASNAVQDALEEKRFAYERLEVSSPGVDRELNRPAHFARFVGEEISVRLLAPIAGKTIFDCRLTTAHADEIVVDVAGETLRVPLVTIKKARLKPVLDWTGVENQDES